MMMMMMMMMNCFCGMVDRRKAFSLISSRDHCQRSSPSRSSDTPRGEFEPAQNLSSGFFEWSCTVKYQALLLHLGPNQSLICVLNFPYDVSLFNSASNMFHMRDPKTLSLLCPNVTKFRIQTLRSSLYLLKFRFFPK